MTVGMPGIVGRVAYDPGVVRTVLRPDYPLETARLTLRPYRSDDLDALHALQSQPEVARYLLWDVRDRDGARKSLERKMGEVALATDGQAIVCAVECRETGAVVGEVNLVLVSSEHETGEIGYVFHPRWGGRGYATEAAERMLRLGFETFGLRRMIGRLDSRNVASARLLERLGMRREAHFVENERVKGVWTDELVYAMLAREWKRA